MPTVELIDTIASLVTIVEEESAKLSAPGRHADLGELAAAKIRLVASLETQVAQLARERPNWAAELEPDACGELAQVVQTLLTASALNADVLGRQIELSTEMMAAVADEAQRLTGTSSATYGAHGGLFLTDQASPISLNARI